jgi:hypothetical protein
MRPPSAITTDQQGALGTGKISVGAYPKNDETNGGIFDELTQTRQIY